nr:ATP-binding cassette domain-containing protein [Nannocystis sp.]
MVELGVRLGVGEQRLAAAAAIAALFVVLAALELPIAVLVRRLGRRLSARLRVGLPDPDPAARRSLSGESADLRHGRALSSRARAARAAGCRCASVSRRLRAGVHGGGVDLDRPGRGAVDRAGGADGGGAAARVAAAARGAHAQGPEPRGGARALLLRRAARPGGDPHPRGRAIAAARARGSAGRVVARAARAGARAGGRGRADGVGRAGTGGGALRCICESPRGAGGGAVAAVLVAVAAGDRGADRGGGVRAAGAAGHGAAPARAADSRARGGGGAGDERGAGGAAAGGVALSLREVGVVAGGNPILHTVDLEVAAGQHIAIVGASGAGKSTLLGLLLGWHRASGGEVRVDGRTLDEATLVGLRQVTAWVDPAVQLWNESLLDNLEYGNREAHARLPETLVCADLGEVLERLPGGLQCVLGENGGLVSGGEGQRVRLGRALQRERPRLVLLDEPLRGLDRDTRARLLARVRERWRGSTLLCVTHDIAAAVGFDRVLVVAEGRIVEDRLCADMSPETAPHPPGCCGPRRSFMARCGVTRAGGG